jgi:hypothetical protein
MRYGWNDLAGRACEVVCWGNVAICFVDGKVEGGLFGREIAKVFFTYLRDTDRLIEIEL